MSCTDDGNIPSGEWVTASDCSHYWVIDSPNGPISNGVCKLCGQEREFRNSLVGSRWGLATMPGRQSKKTGITPG